MPSFLIESGTRIASFPDRPRRSSRFAECAKECPAGPGPDSGPYRPAQEPVWPPKCIGDVVGSRAGVSCLLTGRTFPPPELSPARPINVQPGSQAQVLDL